MVMVQFGPKSAPMSTKVKSKILWEKSVPKEGQKWEKEEILSGNEHSGIEAMLNPLKGLERNRLFKDMSRALLKLFCNSSGE